MFFIIHPCDPTVVICYLIRPCDIAVCITYLISHSYSLTYKLRIFQFGCIINAKLPSCDDIIRRTSLGFHSWCLEARVRRRVLPSTSCENLMMYGGLYQHTRVVLYHMSEYYRNVDHHFLNFIHLKSNFKSRPIAGGTPQPCGHVRCIY